MSRRVISLLTGFLLAAIFTIPVALLFRGSAEPMHDHSTAQGEPPAPPETEAETSVREIDLTAIALASIEAEEDPRSEFELVETLSSLGVGRLEDLCGEALDLPSQQSGSTLKRLLAAWAERDGETAMRWGRENLSGGTWRTCFLAISAAWSATQPAEIAQWLKANQDNRDFGPEGQSWKSSITSRLAFADVVAAAKFSLDELGHTSDVIYNQLRFQIQTVEQVRAIAALLEARNWAGAEVTRHSPEESGAPLGFQSYSVPGKDFSPWQVAKALESRWPEIDPIGWEKWCESHPQRADNSHLPNERAFSEFKEAPSRAAAERAVEAASDGTRGSMMARVVHEWAYQDVNAAGEWLGEQGFTPETWPAIESFASRAIEIDPEAAFAWLDAIPDESRREAMIYDRYGRWILREPAEARQFLEEVDWPDDRKRRLDLLVGRPHQ